MKNERQKTMSSYTEGFTLSASLAIVFSMVLTIVKETQPAVFAFMKGLLGHHWTTHGVAVVLVFVIFGFAFANADDEYKLSGRTLTNILVVSVLIGGLGILGFFLLA